MKQNKVIDDPVILKSMECTTLEELCVCLTGDSVIYDFDSWHNNTQAKIIMGNEKGTISTADIIPGDACFMPDLPHLSELENRSPRYRGISFYYFGDNEKIYKGNFNFILKDTARPHHYTNLGVPEYYSTDYRIEVSWEVVSSCIECLPIFQTQYDYIRRYKQKNPYGSEVLLTLPVVGDPYNRSWGRFNSYLNVAFFMTHDNMETLYKMKKDGITLGFMQRILYTKSQSDLKLFETNFKQGGNIKEIFQLPFDIVTLLWNEPDVSTWDQARKFWKLRHCSVDDIRRLLNFESRNLRLVDEILRAKYNDKPVFSTQTLLNYLNKLNVYEAIDDTNYALQLIRDCLVMCRHQDIQPEFMKQDSIKREHDILVRNGNIEYNEECDAAIKAKYRNKYGFAFDNLFVREIKDYQDLLQEGIQQHNCLRSAYGKHLIMGDCLIYVLRKKDEPDKSLISIELDPTGETVREKFLSHDRPITQPKYLNFFEKWEEFRKEINSQEQTIITID